MRSHFVKICCIASAGDAVMALAAGACAISLVSPMPGGPGVIDEHAIARIAAIVPSPVATFSLTSRQEADAIIEQHEICRTTTIQLIDHVAHKGL